MRQTNLGFNIAMHNALGMNEVNCRHQLPCDRTCFGLGEMLLAADTIEQLSTSQQLHHNVHVKLMKPVDNTLLNIKPLNTATIEHKNTFPIGSACLPLSSQLSQYGTSVPRPQPVLDRQGRRERLHSRYTALYLAMSAHASQAFSMSSTDGVIMPSEALQRLRSSSRQQLITANKYSYFLST